MAAPTFAQLHTKVRRNLGERSASFWDNEEIDELLVDGIRELQDELTPNDALRSLLVTEGGTFNASDPYILLPSAALRFLDDSLVVVEADGEFGYPWKLTTQDYLRSVRRVERDSNQDVTTARLYARAFPFSGISYVEGSYIEVYPSPVSGRLYRVSYIATASESGTMTLPWQDPDLCKLVVYYATFNAASKKSRLDAVMVDRYKRWYEEGRAKAAGYRNRFKMSPARTGRIAVP